LRAQAYEPVPELSGRARSPVSSRFLAVIERASAKTREARFLDARAMREALLACLEAPAPERTASLEPSALIELRRASMRRRSIGAAAALVLGLGALFRLATAEHKAEPEVAAVRAAAEPVPPRIVSPPPAVAPEPERERERPKRASPPARRSRTKTSTLKQRI
jgi:hypothetical protein